MLTVVLYDLDFDAVGRIAAEGIPRVSLQLDGNAPFKFDKELSSHPL